MKRLLYRYVMRFFSIMLLLVELSFPIQITHAQDAIDTQSYALYLNFISYTYTDMKSGANTHYLLEFPIDQNGRYQVTLLRDNLPAAAYVYEMNDTGLYEIAYLNTYHDVMDMRYSPEAEDNQKSLILPRTVSEGMTFSSGDGNPITHTIIDTHATLTIGNITYQNLIQVERTSFGEPEYYYFAPQIGLIYYDDVTQHGHYELTQYYGNSN